MPIEAINTYLPPDQAPSNIVAAPTNYRWGTETEKGPAVRMIESVQGALIKDGLASDTWIMLADESKTPETAGIRRKNLQGLAHMGEYARLFVLTPELQGAVAAIVAGKLQDRADTARAILEGIGYGGQRAKIDAVVGGIAASKNRPIKMVGLDDDIEVPPEYPVIRPEVMAAWGLHPLANSQVLIPNEFDGSAMEMRPNTMRPFINNIGRTVREVRQDYPSLRATGGIEDTMQDKLEEAIRTGRPSQFVVSAHRTEPDLDSIEDARVIATTAIKSQRPDYVALKIARAHLLGEFPNSEAPIKSYLSGPSEPFAYQGCTTNVDSGTLGRLVDPGNVRLPWWFVSSMDISLANPLQTVSGHYRAENDLLPTLLQIGMQKSGSNYVYLGGTETQFFHSRPLVGYRQDPHEQAAASLVGKIAAYDAAQRLYYDPITGEAKMYQVDDGYQAPRDHAMSVYEELDKLAQICAAKITELGNRKPSNSQEWDINDRNLGNYHAVRESIIRKLGGNNPESYLKHLDEEIKQQLKFFAGVLSTMPKVTEVVSSLIAQGKYPVVEFVRT